MNFNYQFVGKLNFFQRIKIIRKVKKISKLEWGEFDFRQKTFEAHKFTQTVPVIFDKNFQSTKTKWYDLFQKELKDIENICVRHYGQGKIVRVILTKLYSQKSIPPHIDSGHLLEGIRRIHIPLISNKKVLFVVDDEVKNMKVGEMLEIYNKNKKPSVNNNRDIDRVHFIVEFINT